ncbi:hypothetical protein [Paludibacter sp.]|uniref:hypothetical protein n=1 Tax=Paludibacter sp. TaxID=1898105 RepID=UPI001354742E|nr:hypothetical protein [Paludibacter sp.]MTK52828.1 hypothetical protein [Paludibacter sp.]
MSSEGFNIVFVDSNTHCRGKEYFSKVDGADLAFVEVGVKDKNGMRCLLANDTTRFFVTVQAPSNATFITIRMLPTQKNICGLLKLNLTNDLDNLIHKLPLNSNLS